jgi:putative DNA methylase
MKAPYRKKLIEVALPLKAINEASAREKSIRHGHPSTLHLWWARRPLAACRAVLFASLVDDPDSDPAYRKADGTVDEDRAGLKRAQLFNLIEELVQWENSNNPRVINAARAEIARCVASRKIELGELAKDSIIFGDGTTAWKIVLMQARPEVVNAFLAEYAPPVLDPFCGGGSIPLEAQRLGLRAYASDLNPVPVLITKALIEIPPKFAGLPPVNPGARASRPHSAAGTAALPGTEIWPGATGLAEDVRYYGQWMRDEAEKRIGHLYPKVKITQEMVEGSAGETLAPGGQDGRAPRPDLKEYVGQELTVIAWLWARTVASPNPACGGAHVPLVRSFWLSTKKGKEAYVEPVIDRETNSYRFVVRTGRPKDNADVDAGTKLGRGCKFRCLLSDQPIAEGHIKDAGTKGELGATLLAVVAEGARGRVYLSPEQVPSVHVDRPIELQGINAPLADDPRNLWCLGYGLNTFDKLFTPRQLVALTTFSDLVQEARAKVLADALGARASRPLLSPAAETAALPALASRPQQFIHDRGYLPHWEAGTQPQSITFRLADSLPQSLLASWEAELQRLPDDKRNAERRRRIEQALDQGIGACHLRRPEIARIVEEALLHFDGTRYQLHAWVVMPNHVHALITPLHGESLSAILHSWKSFTAKAANRVLGTSGQFWQEEYFDRMIRDEAHWDNVVAYIEQNPVKAGLCQRPEDWPFGSAHRGEEKRAGRPRSQDDRPLADGGTGPQAYADAVATYLAFAIDRALDRCSTICSWDSSPKMEALRSTFARQALPMTWDFAEGNPFSESSGNWNKNLDWVTLVIEKLPDGEIGAVKQLDATAAINGVERPMISTDPPYYDNIGYADLSDFFYVWLRRSLKGVYPSLFATALTPKAQELIASPYRHDGDKRKAQEFFETGLGKAFARMHEAHAPDYPLTVYYAFKQQEDDAGSAGVSPATDDDAAETAALPVSTGWETMLAGLIRSGFAITGTWPMRTELGNRMVGMGTNALASSIVLVCRPRPADARLATRKEFINTLRQELPEALKNLQHGNIAPVDMAQSAIGPGMAVFTRYAKVIESDGSPMTVRTALGIINQVLDEVLAEQEGDFDPDTRWALAWFEQHGMEEGPFGVAETLSKAKNTAINGLVEAGIIAAKAGKVRLLRREELLGARASRPHDAARMAALPEWDPAADKRLTVWETTQHLIRTLQTQGESEAAALLNKLGGLGETARELAYRLYSICERKKWADEALAYNSLVIAWPELSKLALSSRNRQSATQADFRF